ncbi:MAG: sigma-54 dependent transcriptional regulator, partial [Candidatus Hydrogenedentes bacterium]|nr:sigma-54 dependent transcriptional regulator [Candidatus Hydrogenedentota bacterium]
EVRAVGSVSDALNIAGDINISAIIMEVLPEAGLTQEVLTMMVDAPGAPRVICVAVDSPPNLVIDCIRRGAADFLPKPFSLAEVRSALNRALDSPTQGAASRQQTSAQRPGADDTLLIGISPAMQELRTVIKQISQTDLNCLLRGESGTGKDMVAREIHRLSRRSSRPFVKVNCTALPEQLLESELFGYEKGAFTGAVTAKPGRFELAHRGIIFLDEIGDMHPNLQAKLLQVIEHKEFTKLGGRRQITVDVQIIAATNADLEAKTKDGSFRGDLYFRLNEVCVWVPPLSARKEDVPLLVRHFMQKHGRFSADAETRVSVEDLSELANHHWPGNVRELESTIKRWLALGKQPLTPPNPRALRSSGGSMPAPEPENAAADSTPDDRPEPERILDALDRFQWNRRKAADHLGMSYQTLRRRITQYGLDEGA